MMEVWEPFSQHMSLYQAWKCYHDSKQKKEIKFSVAELACPDIVQICSGYLFGRNTYVYQGIVTGDLRGYQVLRSDDLAVFLVKGAWKPMVDVSRSRISDLPLYALLAISGILRKYHVTDNVWYSLGYGMLYLDEWKNDSLGEWLKMKGSQLDKWLMRNLADVFMETKQKLQKGGRDSEVHKMSFSINCNQYYAVVDKYLMAYFQDKYQMTISYEDGQTISFYDKKDYQMENAYELFPPMMFCTAASDESRQYICSAKSSNRKGITADHPFVVWLLQYAAQLKQYYQRQFQQIVHCLCEDSADEIIKECNNIREQLLAFPEHHGIEVSAFPLLSMDDFWSEEEE